MLANGSVLAAEHWQISLGTLGSGDWQLRNTSLSIDWSRSGHALMQIDASTLIIGTHKIDKLHLSCPEFELLTSSVDCPAGQLSFRHNNIMADSLTATFHYEFRTRELSINVNKVPIAAGQVNLKFKLSNNRWQINNRLDDINLAEFSSLLKEMGLSSSTLDQQGLISGQLDLSGNNNTGLNSMKWQLLATVAGYSNAEGTQAAEALQMASKGLAKQQKDKWLIQASLTAEQGMLYTEPVYLEFSPPQPLSISVDMHWNPRTSEARFQSLEVEQPGIIHTSLNGMLQLKSDVPVQQLELDIHQGTLPGLYTTWLQPWLAGSLLEKLETDGRIKGHLSIQNGNMQAVALQLDAVSLQQPDGQFNIRRLSSDIHWDTADNVQVSRLSWQAASFYRLQFGTAELALETGAHHLQLQAPLTVPLFDGELQVDEFKLDVSDGKLSWLLDGMLTPISMQSVSTALGWPLLSGTLSGMIPHASYKNHELTLGGILLVQVFDGDITVHNLRVLDPLGTVPRLWADIKLEHLDLKTLTRTFSFGRIEGRLQGHVNDLYMEVWQPVSFDAAFATSSEDSGRRRISQRAVDNISNLGGTGVAGAVSRSFLRFLEDFPYKALGIRCRLENGVCHMGGVGPARTGTGYYLVEGRWLPPRLDVVGYSDEVDWRSLLERLKRISKGEAPVVR